jgi:hypothetical protein
VQERERCQVDPVQNFVILVSREKEKVMEEQKKSGACVHMRAGSIVYVIEKQKFHARTFWPPKFGSFPLWGSFRRSCYSLSIDQIVINDQTESS